MKSVIVDREDLPSFYRIMMETESHHSHRIVDKGGCFRWEEVKDVSDSLEDISLNDLIPLLYSLGYDKNSEVYRNLYRCMGYSLFGYWEVFYWELNNEDCDSYVQP